MRKKAYMAYSASRCASRTTPREILLSFWNPRPMIWEGYTFKKFANWSRIGRHVHFVIFEYHVKNNLVKSLTICTYSQYVLEVFLPKENEIDFKLMYEYFCEYWSHKMSQSNKHWRNSVLRNVFVQIMPVYSYILYILQLSVREAFTQQVPHQNDVMDLEKSLNSNTSTPTSV